MKSTRNSTFKGSLKRQPLKRAMNVAIPSTLKEGCERRLPSNLKEDSERRHSVNP